jgi:hypothetical protein
MHLNRRDGNSTDRVVQGNTRVGVSGGVQHQSGRSGNRALAQTEHAFDQFPLASRLRGLHVHAEFGPEGDELLVEFGQRGVTVQFGFTGAEQIEARPVEDEYCGTDTAHV